jgi:hypothetical protein
MKTFYIFIFSAFILSSCRNYYIAHDFNQRTANHRTIAIAPLEMIFTGNKPNNLSDADLKRLEEGESRAFMISLYNEILRSTRGGKKPIRVSIQSVNNTLSALEGNGISIRDSWKLSSVQLAQILGVDAVVQGSITKKRYMSDLASFGIDLGTQILDIFTGGMAGANVPHQATRTNDIRASYSLSSAGDGTTLFSQAFEYEADWDNTTEEIITYINRRFARNFPYRK